VLGEVRGSRSTPPPDAPSLPFCPALRSLSAAGPRRVILRRAWRTRSSIFTCAGETARAPRQEGKLEEEVICKVVNVCLCCRLHVFPESSQATSPVPPGTVPAPSDEQGVVPLWGREVGTRLEPHPVSIRIAGQELPL